jgi:hypothetical protein
MEKPMSTTETKTCTVRDSEFPGDCGQPAVASGTSRTGFKWAECAEHADDPRSMTASSASSAAAFMIGDTVIVRHAGVTKPATVTHVGRTRITVEVATPHSRSGRPTMRITVPMTEVK